VNPSLAALGALLVLVVPRAAAHAQGFGEVSLRAGMAIATPGDSVVGGTGPAVEASFGTRFGPVVILLEGGYLGVSSERHVWRYVAGARFEFGKGEWRPYVVGGLGGYDDKGRRREVVDGYEFVSDLSWFGVNAGAGVRHGFAGSPFSLLAEGRMHIRMQRVYPDYDLAELELVTVMVGGVLSW
jgi:hypothetical protein